MSARWRVLAFELLLAIIILSITAGDGSLRRSKRYTYGEPLDKKQESLKCHFASTCEAYCIPHNGSAEPNVFNDPRCASSGYHVVFFFTKTTTLGLGWFVNNAVIRRITIRDVGSIESGAFDDFTFRLVWSLELRGSAITVLRKGTFAGLKNLKVLTLYENNEMIEIEENALEGLVQLEELIMEEQKLLSDIRNITGKIEWRYLHSLSLSKNSFGSTIERSTFSGCTRLQKLNLSNSEIEVIGSDSFEPMKDTLTVLDLSNNLLKNIPSQLLGNLIRPNIQFYLSNNLWDCDCDSLELQGYDINNSSLIIDSPLICTTPTTEYGNLMKSVFIPECYTTNTTTTISTTTSEFDPAPTSPPEPPVYLDHLRCLDQSEIAVETEYQFFSIKQEADGKVSIFINYPDESLALVFINDHDYKSQCQYNLKRRMDFDSLYTNAGYLFCLIKKSTYRTSPRNCLPFHFKQTDSTWGRDKIVIILVCSFAAVTVVGIIISWVVICRYRRAVNSKDVVRKRSRSSRSKTTDEFNPWSAYYNGKFFMHSNNTVAKLRRSNSENSLASYKNYMTPSPIVDVIQPRNRNCYDYSMTDFFDKLPYDMLPPPLPPCNGRRERIYERVNDPNFTREGVPYVHYRRKY